MHGSLVEATALSPYLGYEVTAELVKTALASGRSLREEILRTGLLDAATLARLLRPAAVTGPAVLDRRLQRRLRTTPAFHALRASLAPRS